MRRADSHRAGSAARSTDRGPRPAQTSLRRWRVDRARSSLGRAALATQRRPASIGHRDPATTARSAARARRRRPRYGARAPALARRCSSGSILRVLGALGLFEGAGIVEVVKTKAFEIRSPGEVYLTDIALLSEKPGEIIALSFWLTATILAAFQSRPNPQDARARLVPRSGGEGRARIWTHAGGAVGLPTHPLPMQRVSADGTFVRAVAPR